VKKAVRGKLEKRLFIAATIIPGLIPIFLFFFYPIAYALWVSFHNYNLKIDDRSFVGLKNYAEVVTSYYFWNTMKITVIFAILSFLIIIALATGTALLLNERFRGQKILQVLVLVPWAIPYVVGGSMWKWIYNADFGLLNAVLLQLGAIQEFQPWLTYPNISLVLLVTAYVWSELPLPTLLILTGLQSVPEELYESALVDGASSWEKFRKITVEWLKPMFLIVFIWETLLAIRQFDLVWVITQGGPADTTALVSFFTWRETYSFLDFGHGAALSYIILVISVVLIYFYFKALRMGAVELKVR